jgi:hypothetical protein
VAGFRSGGMERITVDEVVGKLRLAAARHLGGGS